MTEPSMQIGVSQRQPVHGDHRGRLVAIEGMRDVPFEIARVYYMLDVPTGEARGFHAHRALHQWAVCVSGSCVMTLDDGTRRDDILLDDAAQGVHIGPMIWREMRDFAEGTVLLVLASAHFDEADYIRDYEAFIDAVRLRASA